MTQSIKQSIHDLSIATSRLLVNNAPMLYVYGTSGFRGPSHTLNSTALRMGAFAAIRSAMLATKQSNDPSNKRGTRVGVMVTASHNDAPDNGLKLVDPTGEMMATAAEADANYLANVAEDQFETELKSYIAKHNIDMSQSSMVYVGQDTRSSSPLLTKLVIAGAEAMGATVTDYGLVTTPMLHFFVRQANLGLDQTVDYYFTSFSKAFKRALQLKTEEDPSINQMTPLTIDCANGVGSVSLRRFASELSDVLPMTLVNTKTDRHDLLNALCGAEHVQKTKTFPLSFHPSSSNNQSNDQTISLTPSHRCCSVDGDADRIVYFYQKDDSSLGLLDGDKILVLYTAFISQLLKKAGLDDKLSIGCVQTAYANGASVRYVREQLGIQPAFTSSGVKHLHHVAASYDIGVYFESNGHGTVCFSSKAVEALHSALQSTADIKQRRAIECLICIVTFVNQCVGDAVSDMLLVEAALFHLGWTLQKWDSIYRDLPSLTLKVKVVDRNVITVTDADRICVTPPGLQDAINAAVANGIDADPARRSFARPSGTEDVVRVYAEAETPEACAQLANDVCQAVAKYAGGL